MVEIIRDKWCEDLEDLLQCSICMGRPPAAVYQCIEGHHVCEECKTQLENCPTCQGRWSTSRNRLAESLCGKLDEIKLSLIDPEGEINKLLLQDRESVATQTEKIAISAVVAPRKKTAARQQQHSSSAYPCHINYCGATSNIAQLIQHVADVHPTQYVEVPLDDSAVMQHAWLINCIAGMNFDRAVQVIDFGMFFLKLSMDSFGNFTGFLMMAQSSKVSKKYSYQLELSCCAKHGCPTYTGDVVSCSRLAVGDVPDKCLQIKRARMQRLMDHERELQCTLLLVQKSQALEEGRQSELASMEYRPKVSNSARSRVANAANGEDASRPGSSTDA